MNSPHTDSQEIIRLLQDELAETNREVIALALELEKRVERRTAELEAANRELEAFSYSVSHDLRAPLRAISGFAGILVETYAAQLPAEARRFLDIIATNTNRMEQIIEGLLRLSRSGRQELVKQPIRVSSMVRGLLDEFRQQLNGREVEIRVEELADCTGDPALIKQVFSNLLSNAFKFTRETKNARIEIGCLDQDGEVVYSVRDNGAGFDMAYAGKLFGTFQRLHREEQFEGTGIGLSIVQRIVRRHEGRIWAEGKVNGGAIFHFTLAPPKKRTPPIS